MYSTGVEYSTLSISSLTRNAETTSLTPLPTAGVAPNEEERQSWQKAKARRLLTINHALLVTMGHCLWC
jgi:hypothetical protein